MRFRLIIFVLAIMSISALSAKNDYVDPYKDYDEAIFMDLDIESNLAMPQVPQSCAAGIRRYINRIATDLAKQRYTVDLLRDDEVILVTIPTDELFLPNDTLLSSAAASRLQPVIKLFAEPDMYKVLYAVHTDNTGSAKYNMMLSHKRNNSLYDYILDQVSEDLIIIPYEYGDTEPVEPNNTREGRKANRRLEIFLMPGPKMIEMAHKQTLQ